MKIIDAHAHLWLHQNTVVNGQPIHQLEPNRSRSLFFGEERQMLPPYMTDGLNTAERFLSNMDYAQVSAAVITQEFIDGLQNDYLDVVQRQYPDRFFVFGMPDWRQAGYYHELMDGDVQVSQMEEIIAAHPHLRIIIGHFGMVTRPNWMSQIQLARHENVFVESGGITWLFNDEFYPFPSAVRAIKEAADAVGMEKLMWGSDYPRTITAITYKMSYDFVTKSKELTDNEKKLFLSENAKRFFGFGELIELPYIKNMSE